MQHNTSRNMVMKTGVENDDSLKEVGLDLSHSNTSMNKSPHNISGGVHDRDRSVGRSRCLAVNRNVEKVTKTAALTQILAVQK